MTSFTASGARRTGDEYQDLQSAEVLIQWLENPELYAWVHLEAMDGSLDDIQAQRSDGTLRLLQVKFATDEGDRWGWEELLEGKPSKRGGTLPSLLQKWKESVDAIQRAGSVIHEAAFYTNREAMNAIVDYLTPDGFIEFDKLSADLKQRLASQLGGVAEAANFFASFRFRFQERSYETLSSSLKQRFRQLGGTNEGWWSLINSIRRWINRNDEPNADGRILLADVESAALWHLPAQIPQGFAVPADYVAPQTWSERHVVPCIQQPHFVQVVTGAPGAGKSTYLSWLVGRIQSTDQPVIRHHFFLSTTDPTPGRSSWETAAGSLILQLRTAYRALTHDAGDKNPAPAQLQEYLTSAGQQRRGLQPLVVIIDGLDHVWRDTGDDEDLRKLFDLLLPAPEGVTILIGTQDVDIARLPLKLREACPRETWVTVPSLSREEVNEWILHHTQELGAVSEGKALSAYLSSISDALYEVTSGHPLILHYALSQMSSSALVRADQVLALPRFTAGTGIADYYRRLYDDLPSEARHLLHLLAGFPWAWPRDGLVQCLAPQADAARLDAAERAIRHLLGTSRAGITAFHESLLAFTRALPNHRTTADSLRPGVLRWLALHAPSYWRWRHEWIEQRRAGDSAPLITGPNLDWCVDALTSGRTRDDILRVVSESGWAALDAGDFATATHRHFVDERLDDAYTSEGVLGRLLLLGSINRHGQIADTELDLLAAGLTNASVTELRAISEIAARLRRIDVCIDAAEECGSRWNAAVSSLAGSQKIDTMREHFPFLIAAALTSAKDSEIRDVVNRDGDYPHWCEPARYARALARLCALADDSAVHRDELRFLANHPKMPVAEAADEIVRLACYEGFRPDRWLTSPEASRAEMFRSLRAMVGELSKDDSEAQTRSFAPAWDLSRSERDDIFVEFARSYFFACFAAAAVDDTRPEPNNVDERADYVASLLDDLADVAKAAAASCRGGEKTGGAWFLARMQQREHDEPAANDYANRFARRSVCSKLFIAVAIDLEGLFHAATGTWSLSAQVFNDAISARITYAIDWIRACVESGRPLHDITAAEAVINTARNELDGRLDYVETRADEYGLIAHFSHLHRRPMAQTQEFLHLSARHLFGHAFHKDVILFDYLEALKDFTNLDANSFIDSVRAAEPIIEAIREITDGDETRYLPGELGEVLIHRAPDALPGYIRKLQWNYDHWQAEVVATELARAMPLATQFDRALASTLVHEEALEAWEARVDTGNEQAQAVLRDLDAYLGRHKQKQKDPESARQHHSEQTAEAFPIIAAYPPDSLKAFVASVRAAGSFGDQHLVAWTRHWIERDPEAVLDAFAAYVRTRDEMPETTSMQQIIGIALEHRGRGEAWHWLVRFHQAIYGWTRYMYPLSQAQLIWRVLKDVFYDRWLEFVVATSAPRWRRIKASPSWSIHRMVLFLVQFGRLDDARAVVNAAREWVLGLAVNMRLPNPAIQLPQSGAPYTLGLLVERLDCPSRLVQDRASSALVELLGAPVTRDSTMAALEDWHANHPNEIKTCLILQLIWLAALRFSLSIEERTALVARIQRIPSAGERLLIGRLGVDVQSIVAAQIASPLPSEAFRRVTRFREIVSGHLAPVFLTWASSLDTQGLEFTRRWREEFARLGQALPSHINIDDAVSHFHYSGSEDSGFLEISDAISTILRAAYLRTVQALVESGDLAPAAGLPHQVRATLQTDPPFWTEPSSAPRWWPIISPDEPDQKELEGRVRQALRMLERPVSPTDPILLYASGPLVATPILNVHLTVQAFLQSAVGATRPAIDDIIAISEVRCSFDDELAETRTYSSSEQYAGQLEDWILAPLGWLTARADVHPWLRPHLAASLAPLPAAWLFEGEPRVTASGSTVTVSDIRGTMARRVYWNAALRGRSHHGEGPRVGFELTCDRALLQPHTDAGADLCWVAFVLSSKRERYAKSFEPRKLAMSVLVGGSRIVLPKPWVPPAPK